MRSGFSSAAGRCQVDGNVNQGSAEQNKKHKFFNHCGEMLECVCVCVCMCVCASQRPPEDS